VDSRFTSTTIGLTVFLKHSKIMKPLQESLILLTFCYINKKPLRQIYTFKEAS